MEVIPLFLPFCSVDKQLFKPPFTISLVLLGMFLPASLLRAHVHHICWSGLNHIFSLSLYSESDWQIPFHNHLWLTLKASFILCRSAVVSNQWRGTYAFPQNDLCHYNLLWFSPLFSAPVRLTCMPWLFWLTGTLQIFQEQLSLPYSLCFMLLPGLLDSNFI